MKKLALKLLTLIALAIAFSSCSDDDDKNDPAGKFTVDGETFNLAKGYTTYDGVFSAGDDDYHYWIIVLASDGLTFEDDDFEPIGTGDAVILEIAVLNDDSFVPAGSYSLDDDTGYCYAVLVDYNFGAGTGTAYEEPETLHNNKQIRQYVHHQF